MSERKWLKIHNGLLDPEHREALGVRVWLFMYLIDRADWETGIVNPFRDAEAETDLDMTLSTVRRQRRELEEAGYITCKQGDQCQHIIIHRWRNPRYVEAPQINLPQGESSKVDTPGGIVLDTPPATKVITPTYSSQENHSSTSGNGSRPEYFTVYEQNVGPLTPHIADMLGDYADDPLCPVEWIGDAIKEAAENGVRKLKYIAAILDRWMVEGRDAPKPDLTIPAPEDDPYLTRPKRTAARD